MLLRHPVDKFRTAFSLIEKLPLAFILFKIISRAGKTLFTGRKFDTPALCKIQEREQMKAAVNNR